MLYLQNYIILRDSDYVWNNKLHTGESTKYTHFLHAYNTQMAMGYYIPRLDLDRGMDWDGWIGLGWIGIDGLGWYGWRWRWIWIGI